MTAEVKFNITEGAGRWLKDTDPENEIPKGRAPILAIKTSATRKSDLKKIKLRKKEGKIRVERPSIREYINRGFKSLKK